MKYNLDLVVCTLGMSLTFGSCSQQTPSLPQEIPAPVPYTYYPISFDENSIELLGRMECEVPITLIEHKTGTVFHTKTAKTGYRVDDYKGRYSYTSLASQANFEFSANYIRDVSSITAIAGQPNGQVKAIEALEIDDRNLAKKLDTRVREEGHLDSLLGKRPGKNVDLNNHKALENKLPNIYKIQIRDLNATLISYEVYEKGDNENGPKLILLENKLMRFWGSCSAMPYFYTVGERLYSRSLSSICGSGYISVGNYLVHADSLVLEWATLDYAN